VGSSGGRLDKLLACTVAFSIISGKSKLNFVEFVSAGPNAS
jgi:hypothetical protein